MKVTTWLNLNSTRERSERTVQGKFAGRQGLAGEKRRRAATVQDAARLRGVGGRVPAA